MIYWFPVNGTDKSNNNCIYYLNYATLQPAWSVIVKRMSKQKLVIQK